MKTGIIGLGKMGGALLRGMLKAGAVSPEEVWVYDHHHENVQALQQEYPGVHEAATEADAADAVEALILAVKPHGVLSLISSLSERGEELPLLISIAAAISLDDMEACASDGTRIVRAMPNTPCMVLAGVIAYSTGAAVTDEDEEAAPLRLRLRLQGGGSQDERRFRHFRQRARLHVYGAGRSFGRRRSHGTVQENRPGNGRGNHAGVRPHAGTDREASHGAPG